MIRSYLMRPRVRVAAAVASAAVIGATIYATGGGPAGAAPAGAAGGAAKAVAASKVKLKGQHGKTVAEGSTAASRTPRGLALPRHGRLSALIELNTPSTLAAFDGASAQGRTAAKAAARSQYLRIKTAQARIATSLATAAPGSRVLYQTHSAVAGVVVNTDAQYLPRLLQLAGVKAVHPIATKKPANSYAVPLQKAPEGWTAYGDLGQDSTIAVIDTGIDYTHANFGGVGTSAAYDTAKANDAQAATAGQFPNSKIIGGTDLVGDAYNADDPTHSTPQPDPNPLDCNGHGSHVAGTAAGFGVDSAGATFAGPYNTGTPFSSLRIGPGMAPKARLYAFKVFGCDGSTNEVSHAIELALDPNGDGDPSDHADVINMSLGSDFGSQDDGDSLSANMAADQGVTVVVASGNAGDYFDVGGSPGDAVKAIAVANSVDAYNQIDSVHVTAPAGIVGNKGAQRSISYDWAHDPDLSGTVVAPSDAANKDGCAALSPADATAVNGKVVFLEWSDDNNQRRCGSASRADRMAAAGATGVILADDAETFAAGITGDALIPEVQVIKSAGDELRAQLGNGLAVNGTAAGDFRQVVPADDDKVNDSSSRGIRRDGNVKPDVAAVGTSVFSTAVGTGNQGTSLTGTSMATPMVAGEAALVKSRHPDWTPLEIKADIMNTADQDLFTGSNHTGDRYAPNRVGSGRIDVKAALDNPVLAYNVESPGAVSVSFGPVAVTGPTTLRRTVKVVNKGLDAVTYGLSYDAITSVPGVSFSVASSQADTTKVTVGARSSAIVTVTFAVTDRTLMTKTLDPTMARTQGPEDLPRNFLADASGHLVLTPVGADVPALRVPVYAAPRPASTMTQPGTINLPAGAVQTATLPLTGTGVQQGQGDEAIQSIVSGYELQATSGLAPTCTATVTVGCVHSADERSGDVKYVATTSDAPQQANPVNEGLAYFAITTQGAWQTEAVKQEFDVYIDSTGDNVPDAVLFNTRFVDATGQDQDIFVSELVDINTGDVLDVEAINLELGDVDTAEFDSDTLVMPVAVAALPGVSVGHSRIRYGVLSFAENNPVDAIGMTRAGALANPLSTDVLRPGLTVGVANNGVLFEDMPNTSLFLRHDTAAYQADKGLGALMVHFHNKVGSKAQVVHLKVAATVGLTLSTGRIKFGGRVDAKVTVGNTNNAVPSGKVSIVAQNGATVISGTLKNGVFATKLPNLRPGTYRLHASYPGDGNYTAGSSGQVTLVVTS